MARKFFVMFSRIPGNNRLHEGSLMEAEGLARQVASELGLEQEDPKDPWLWGHYGGDWVAVASESIELP